jgi:ribonucleotide reductase beta subunit family protein with ferritin-like domain
MQLVSAIMLIVALFLIRRFLVANGLGDDLNDKSMFLHGLSFSLYIISILFYYGFYWTFTWKHTNKATRSALIAWIVTTFTNFTAQICLSVILY